MHESAKRRWLDDLLEVRQYYRTIETDAGKTTPAYCRLVDELLEAAHTYIIQSKADESHAEDHYSAAISVASALRSAYNEHHYRPDLSELNYESNLLVLPKDPYALVQAEKAPYIDKSELIAAVEQYLQLPFRCAVVDRLLVQGLERR